MIAQPQLLLPGVWARVPGPAARPRGEAGDRGRGHHPRLGQGGRHGRGQLQPQLCPGVVLVLIQGAF